MKRIIRATTVVAAPCVMAVALLAACGGSDRGTATSPAAGEQVDAQAIAWLEAQAEHYEWSAHLRGQAWTHGNTDSSDDMPAPAGEASDDESVPGSRHMPTR